ncbi:MAG: aldo/keto reductase [Deltaproteobacteria bacterium]|nr:aldo/keto reductase [Deltaproteobacteria bacterium]
MDYRWLGRTGVKISRLVFGTMGFGGESDEAGSAVIYGRCRDLGINLFDCADVYQAGRSEEILGRLSRGHRDEVVLASKAYFPTGRDPNARGASRYHLVRAVEGSLKRLKTDRIDLYYLHRFDEETALDESLRALDDLVRAGKILYLGASNFAAWQVMKANGLAERAGRSPFVALQPMYNLVKRQAEVEILPMAQSEGLAVFSYSPLGGGLLTGKYKKGGGGGVTGSRLSQNKMYQTRYGSPAYWEAAEALSTLAEKLGHHPVSLAVAWVMAHPGITAPILGARSLEQLEPALAALNVEMTPELYAQIGALFPSPPPATDRNEETSNHNYGAR